MKLSVILPILLAVSIAKPALSDSVDPFTIDQPCTNDVCVSVEQNGETIGFSPYPTAGFLKETHAYAETLAWIPIEYKNVTLKVASITGGAGDVCIAARDKDGILRAVPSGKALRDEAAYQDVEDLKFEDWDEGECLRIHTQTYQTVSAYKDGTKIRLTSHGERAVSSALIVAYFSESMLLSSGEKKPESSVRERRTEPDSLVRIMIGDYVPRIMPAFSTQ